MTNSKQLLFTGNEVTHLTGDYPFIIDSVDHVDIYNSSFINSQFNMPLNGVLKIKNFSILRFVSLTLEDNLFLDSAISISLEKGFGMKQFTLTSFEDLRFKIIQLK